MELRSRSLPPPMERPRPSRNDERISPDFEGLSNMFSESNHISDMDHRMPTEQQAQSQGASGATCIPRPTPLARSRPKRNMFDMPQTDFEDTLRDYARHDNLAFKPPQPYWREREHSSGNPYTDPTPPVRDFAPQWMTDRGYQPRNTSFRAYERPTTYADFKPRIPTFDGKIDSWEPFLMQMRLLARSYRWSDWQLREQIIFALRGEASMFVSTLPIDITDDTQRLLRAMEQRFGACLLAETHRANLYNVRKHAKESMQQYSARVSQMMARAYPGMMGTDIFNNLAIEHLLRGLPDQKLAYEILTRKPRDISETVDMITWHEACKQYTNRGPPSGIRHLEEDSDLNESDDNDEAQLDMRRVNGRKAVTEERINQLWRDMQKYMSEQMQKILNIECEEDKKYSKPKRDIVCFTCNKPGHISPECPLKQNRKLASEQTAATNETNQENLRGLC